MKMTGQFAVVLVTAPDLKTARKLARGALGQRLIACANIVPRVESHYWWRGKMEQGKEVLMVMKTARRKLKTLEKFVVAEHPYDTPEFVVMALSGGNEKYLKWMEESLG